MENIKLFATSNSIDLSEQICRLIGIEPGKFHSEQFLDGEVYVQFNESVRGKTVFIVGQVDLPYSNLFELYLAVDAAKRASAKEVICIVPYFVHSRQERKDKNRSSIAARVIADFFENAGADRMITVDLHTSSIEGLFKIPTDHLSTDHLFADEIAKIGSGNLLLCSPDFGGVKRVKNIQNLVKSDIAIINKERLKANEVAKMEIIGDVSEKDVIIIDDMIDTAGTLVKAADLILQSGARSVRAYCTHGIFSGQAVDRISSSALEAVVVTDTIHTDNLPEKIRTVSVAGLLKDAVLKLVSAHTQLITG